MTVIRSAVLLAAGRGKRQGPYTHHTPKPLLKANGRETLDYVLSAVRYAGVERVCLVTHYLQEQIIEYVGSGSRWDLEASFARQEHLSGSGHALLSVPPLWLEGDPAVMVIATDYILDLPVLRELVEAHHRQQADITMSLKACAPEELMARCTVQVDDDWRVQRIIEKPRREQILGPYAASLLFILPSVIWDYLQNVQPSNRGEIEIQAAIDLMLADGFKACGVLQGAPLEWSPELLAGEAQADSFA